MATKTSIPSVIFNDLPKKTKAEPKVVKIAADDPGIRWLWEAWAEHATNRNYCSDYDRLAKQLGGPSRASMRRDRYTGWDSRSYYRSLSAEDPDGNKRQHMEIIFKGSFTFMNQNFDLEYKTKLYTSGTREDIEYVTYFRSGKTVEKYAQTGLRTAQKKKIAKLIEESGSITLS